MKICDKFKNCNCRKCCDKCPGSKINFPVCIVAGIVATVAVAIAAILYGKEDE